MLKTKTFIRLINMFIFSTKLFASSLTSVHLHDKTLLSPAKNELILYLHLIGMIGCECLQYHGAKSSWNSWDNVAVLSPHPQLTIYMLCLGIPRILRKILVQGSMKATELHQVLGSDWTLGTSTVLYIKLHHFYPSMHWLRDVAAFWAEYRFTSLLLAEHLFNWIIDWVWLWLFVNWYLLSRKSC